MRLSKSALDKFLDCPRCFYLKYKHKLDQPDMISSKAWKGIERVALCHYEKYRGLKLTPPNLVGLVPEGSIPYQGDRISLPHLRYWGKGLRFMVDGVEVSTALDDMLQRPGPDGKTVYSVIDLKSKSKETDEESTRKLYQTQADVFDLAANVNEYPTDGTVFFDYWSPLEVQDSAVGVTIQAWKSQVISLKADHERCKKLVLAAAACIDGPMPDPNFKVVVGKKGGEKIEGCAVCAYIFEREKILKALAEGKQ